MANSVYPDETAQGEPSHLDLHCLHSCLFWSAGLKGLRHITETRHVNMYNVPVGYI